MTGAPASQPLWTPSPERIATTNLARFARESGFDPVDYAGLHRWSIDEPEAFWRAIWTFCEIVGDPGERVIEHSPALAANRFFPDATLNVAENLLAHLPSHQPVVIAHTDQGHVASMTADELRRAVASFAGVLRENGVVAGDRVVVMLPNGIEAIVAMLGAATIGAVFASASPDFGATAVLDRFGQIEPAVFVACAGYSYNGKSIDVTGKAADIARQLPTCRLALMVGDEPAEGFQAWSDALEAHADAALEFEQLPFDHPWYILFSSGTTGVPKCIVHRAGGVLVMHAKEHRLNCDIQPDDVVMYYTTTGWMMWNWLVSALAAGATIVTYDGSPMYPTHQQLFDIVERERINLLGVSAKFIDSLASNNVDVRGYHDLSTLRTICSTGSPLGPHGFEYIYAAVKSDVHLASISGGTDLCACFVGGVPTLPVFSGELQARALGMAVEFVDDDGRPLGIGDGPGELVCMQPFPSQPLGFWNDVPFGPEGPKYRSTYYERFPGAWAHGDFASWGEHGGAVIHGRSDATLNPGGVRIGTADIYRVVDAMPEVVESIAFGQQVDDDVRIILAVHVADDVTFDDAFVSMIRSAIRAALSPRHVPAIVVSVSDVPRTYSGKLVEIAVTDAVNGRVVRNRDSIANPDALDAIVAAMS